MLFTCPSRYSSTIGHTGVLSLGGWSPQFHARLLVSGVTQEHYYAECIAFAYRAITVSGAPFQGTSASFILRVRRSYNPAPTRRTVWAGPVSLATTQGISVDFSSSGYLDVSVLQVSSIYLCIQYTVTGLQPAGFPHSEIHGSKLVCSSPWLIAAYHVLHRPYMPRHPPYAINYLSPAILRGLDSCRFDALMSRYIVYNGCLADSAPKCLHR